MTDNEANEKQTTIMKHCKYPVLLAVAALLPLIYGCQGAPAHAVEGEYSLTGQSVQINGVIINLSDWPGSSVAIDAIDDDMATVIIDSLLPGFSTLSLPVSVSRDGRNKYTFSSTDPYDINDREISVSGSIKGGDMSISITDIFNSPVTGRWKPVNASDGLPELSIQFSNPMITEVTIGETTLPIETAVAMLNSMARSWLSTRLEGLRYLELGNTGYVNISWNGDISPELEPILQDVIQYWPEPELSWVHIFLRRTIADGIGSGISPIDASLTYTTTSGGGITLGIDKHTFSPWAAAVSAAIQEVTYEDYLKAGSPLGELSQEEFLQYRQMMSLLVTALTLSGTEFSVTMGLTSAF